MGQSKNLGFYKHGNLPHLDAGDAIQFVSFVLADAAPKKQLPRNNPGMGIRCMNSNTLNDQILDKSHGRCILRVPLIANTVLCSILLRDSISHDTLAWVIMPNHVHVLLRQRKDFQLSKVVKQIKAGSAFNIRKIMGIQGPVWQRGYFDRFIRNPEHLRKTVSYIHQNPVRARLVSRPQDWQWSSYSKFDSSETAARFSLPPDWFSDV
jgi:REP element-mobilizing transposase RayT